MKIANNLYRSYTQNQSRTVIILDTVSRSILNMAMGLADRRTQSGRAERPCVRLCMLHSNRYHVYYHIMYIICLCRPYSPRWSGWFNSEKRSWFVGYWNTTGTAKWRPTKIDKLGEITGRTIQRNTEYIPWPLVVQFPDLSLIDTVFIVT